MTVVHLSRRIRVNDAMDITPTTHTSRRVGLKQLIARTEIHRYVYNPPLQIEMALNTVTGTIGKVLPVQRFLEQLFIENIAWFEKKRIEHLLALDII